MKIKTSLVIFLLVCSVSFLMAAHPGLRTYSNVAGNPDRADSLTGFDITKYELTLTVNDATHQISGNVVAHVTSESNLTAIEYNLVGLTVSEVRVNNVVSNYTHTNGIIHIPVNFASGQSFTTKVTYGGTPQLSPNQYNVGMVFGNNMVFTISDPDACRYWWPCYDHPWDKAVVDLHITMRSDWLVAANGIRASIVDNGNGTKTHNWIGSNPMVPYLACIAAGPYLEINQMAGTVPIQNFVFQSQYNNAMIDFSILPEILQYYETQFGTYPFEKYGNAVVNMSTFSAMEHQTMTTLGTQNITGTHSGEFTIAHELAHQWYGDAVSPLTFRDVWLSEGFATYAEALWSHHRDGWLAACDYVGTMFHQSFISFENQQGSYIIYNPEFNNYFAPLSYEKSASVLHMLRLKMGSAGFMQLLQNWFTTYRDGNVTTAEFQAMAEQISGLDLDQFFTQWIYQNGIPSVDYTIFSNTDLGRIKIKATTSSPTSTQFHLDIPVALSSAIADSVVIKASPTGFINDFPYNTAADLSTLSIDPRHWVLARQHTVNALELVQCMGSNSSALLSWNAYTGSIPITGYLVWRKLATDNNWGLINQNPLSTTDYIDITAQNGMVYQYRISAITSDGYQSVPSNIMTATPVDFAFNLGILVVDETRDGNGTAISPTDEQVDDFYADALAPFEFDVWDYAAQDAPALSTLGQYSLVIWHADDFTQNQLLNNLDLIGSYLMGGGKFILSGWKTPSAFSSNFTELFLPDTSLIYDNGAVLNSAQSGAYPTLLPDTAKLTTVWNAKIPMVYTFQGATNVLYTADMTDTALGDGLPVAARYDYPGEFVIFGFPLYCMQAAGVRELLQQLIPELFPAVSSSDNIAPEVNLQMSAFPNPFRESVIISLNQKLNTKASFRVFNAKGQLVRSLSLPVSSELGSSLVWDGTNENGKSLPCGIYFLKCDAGNLSLSRKIVLFR